MVEYNIKFETMWYDTMSNYSEIIDTIYMCYDTSYIAT